MQCGGGGEEGRSIQGTKGYVHVESSSMAIRDKGSHIYTHPHTDPCSHVHIQINVYTYTHITTYTKGLVEG